MSPRTTPYRIRNPFLAAVRVTLPVALLVTLACGVTPAVPQDTEDPVLEPRMRPRNWRPIPAGLEHLKLRDARELYRGPSSLRNRFPYLVAAGAADRVSGKGVELRVANAHRLFEPVTTEVAARELARLFSGGSIVPDARAYASLRATALRLEDEAGWTVKVEDGAPQHFGVSVARVDGVLTVHTLVFTSSGYGALDVAEQSYRFPADSPVERTVTTWIHGPPQSWQTSGEVDADEQARLHAAVRSFRESMTAVLAERRTLATVRAAVARDRTFAEMRRQLGEPDRDIGSGVHVYVYGVSDGSAVIFGVANADEPPHTVRHMASVGPGGPGSARVGALIEDLTP